MHSMCNINLFLETYVYEYMYRKKLGRMYCRSLIVLILRQWVNFTFSFLLLMLYMYLQWAYFTLLIMKKSNYFHFEKNTRFALSSFKISSDPAHLI